MEALSRALANDRLVMIYVGEQNQASEHNEHSTGDEAVATPSHSELHGADSADRQAGISFVVPQVLLESISSYFIGALREGAFAEGAKAEIRFPTDDCDAWKVLLYWIVHRQPPDIRTEMNLDWDNDDHENILVRCWSLGDRYNIPSFQDETMLALLAFFETRMVSAELPIVRLAFRASAPGSKLRKLYAEEIVIGLRHADPRRKIKASALDALDGIAGVRSEILEAMTEYDSAGNACPPRFYESNRWRDFMVGLGPQSHWVYSAHKPWEDDVSVVDLEPDWTWRRLGRGPSNRHYGRHQRDARAL